MTNHALFGFRVSEADRKLIERAAEAERRSMASFVRHAAVSKAEELFNNDNARTEEIPQQE